MSRRLIAILVSALLLVMVGVVLAKGRLYGLSNEVGEVIDSISGVKVYYNGSVGNVSGRNVAKDGYNLGQKYQCVEFVKRYYYEYYKHKMPDSYGHARDFFDASVADGKRNTQRDLLQYTNGSRSKPREGDLVVFSGTMFNPYGHVAIISAVYEARVEIIQQNPGPSASTREEFELLYKDEKWHIDSHRAMGWLRKE